VGEQLAYVLTSDPHIDELYLYDIIHEKSDGIVLDISHAYPEFSHKLKTGKPPNTENSELIVITAGVPRAPGVSNRESLLGKNKEIIRDVLSSIDISNKTKLLITTNPVESVSYIAYELSAISPERVLGFGSSLDSKRMQYILSKKTGVPAQKIECMIIGEHGSGMIPLFSQCKIDGKPMADFNLNEGEIERLIKESSTDIVNWVGGTRFGPVKSLEEVVQSILGDSKKTFPMGIFAKSEFYGIEDVFISLPVKIGQAGATQIIEINLNDTEKERLKILSGRLKKTQCNLDVKI
jgi:malate/lactate dehydrogenase